MPETYAIITDGPLATRRAGAVLGGLCQPGDVIALVGGLGAGKTALVQGLADGLGVTGHVPSPTFNILLVHRGVVPLYHFDLYRLEYAEQLVDIDFYETLESDGVSAIEWADHFPDELPDERLDVSIEVMGESGRDLEVTGHGTRAEALARAWYESWSAGQGAGR